MGRPKLKEKLIRANHLFTAVCLRALKDESDKTGIPQTVIVRQALEKRLSRRIKLLKEKNSK